jgi:hypothetical protein
MRTLAAFIFLSAALLNGQEHNPAKTCGEHGQGLLTDAYYQAVLERALRPPNERMSLISISVSGPYAQWRLVLRERGSKFELLRGTTESHVYESLADLDATCQLPSDVISAERLKVKWESVELPAAKFGQLHREFTSALSQYASNVQARYAPLLATGTFSITFHVPEYTVLYDNRSEHIEIRAVDSTPDPDKMDPIVKWTHSVLKLGEESFPKK